MTTTDADREAAVTEMSAIMSERFRKFLEASPRLASLPPSQAADLCVAFGAGWLACTDWINGR